MNLYIIMLQNKLLNFYFELKLQVRRMEKISLRLVARSWFQPVLWDVLEQQSAVRSLAWGPWSCLYCGQVIKRCSWIPFY